MLDARKLTSIFSFVPGVSLTEVLRPPSIALVSKRCAFLVHATTVAIFVIKICVDIIALLVTFRLWLLAATKIASTTPPRSTVAAGLFEFVVTFV